MLLGNLRFGPDLDVWSLGCVAAELFLRAPLFLPRSRDIPERSIVNRHFEFLGTPPKDTKAYAWMTSLPFFGKFYGIDSRILATNPPQWPPAMLRDCQAHLADFVRQTLKLNPRERPSAASASQHEFVSSRALTVAVSVAKGKKGHLGSIAHGCLDDEVLDYLQNCPSWEQWHAECRRNQFNVRQSHGISRTEGALGMKVEKVGYIDATKPPQCRSLHGDAGLSLIQSERLQCFVKALRRGAKTWLQKLTSRVRDDIVRLGLPPEFLSSNGTTFMEEDFADNAFVYATVQLMKIGGREDGWHTDGGASLLHAAVTIFGSRTLQVKPEDAGCISLPQRPGSFYVGNLCALSHNVVHSDHAAGSFGVCPPSEQVQIAVMLRTDVFRAARARVLNTTPGPEPLFAIVNTATAKHLAEHPLYLPDLAAIIAESREARTYI
jgi:hypothetical protein